MRRPLVALLLLAVALLVSACAASNAPGWTYAPPTPSPTAGPSQSADASAVAPSAASSGAAPSADASAGAGGGSIVDITAQNVAFTTTDVTAPAGAPFTIHFDNQDASIMHNVVIKDASGMDMFTGEIVTGVIQKDYAVPALAAGAYTFICQVHPNMTGKLTVGP